MKEVKILDQHGKPISISEENLQTSKIGWLSREFADHPKSGLTPAKLANLLIDTEAGNLKAQCELADDVEEDAHVFTGVSKRKQQVAAFNWDVVTTDDATTEEKDAAEKVKTILVGMINLEDLILDMMDALLKGFSCLEIAWEYTGFEWIPKIYHRPASWFTTRPEDRNKLLLRNAGMGEELQPLGWITHIHKSKSGYLTRAGLIRVVVWPYLFLNYSVRDLAELLEIYGIPIGLGKYPRNASDAEKNTLLKALINIGHNARGIIPEGMAIDFLDAAKPSSADPFTVMIEWAQNSISKATEGGTLTSNSNGGTKTNALGNVHERAFWQLGTSDGKQVQSTLTRDLIYPLAMLNSRKPIRMGKIKFQFDLQDSSDDKSFAETLKTLTESGMGKHIPVSWVREKLRIPAPKDGEATLDSAAPAPTVQAALSKQLPAPANNEDYADYLSKQLAKAAQPVLDNTFTPIVALVKSAKSLEEIQTGLENMYPDMNQAAFAELIGEAYKAAYLAGMDDVARGK